MPIYLKIICAFLLVQITHACYAQDYYIWGKTPKTSITFLPVGSHLVWGKQHKGSNNENLILALNYQSLAAGTFINSMNNRIYYVGIMRDVFARNHFSAGYIVGLMHGYHGSLKKYYGPVFGNDPGPIACLYGRYQFAEHLSVTMDYHVLGVAFGGSWIF
jgi:hypothetical protein